MIGHVRAALEVARKEIMEHVRTKRIFIIGGIFAITFFLVAFAATQLSRELGPEILNPEQRVPFILAFYFGFLSFIGGYTYTSVLGIVLSGDAIVGEWKDRTLFLLFSKPVSRHAVLAGKILGAYAAVLLVLTAVFATGLGLIVALVGAPNAAGWGRILGFFGMLAVGLLPFLGLGILCSTWFKTPVTSFIVALGLWLIGFPIVGRLGEIILFIQRKPGDVFRQNDMVDFFHYFDPMNLLQASSHVLLKQGEEDEFISGFQGAPENIPMALLAMGLFTAFFLALSFWIVARRDYA